MRASREPLTASARVEGLRLRAPRAGAAGEEAPEDGPQSYEELDDTEQAYVRLARELDYARAAGDDELAAEIQEEIDAMGLGDLPEDRGREDAGDGAGVEEQKLDPAEVLEDRRAFAEKYGWA